MHSLQTNNRTKMNDFCLGVGIFLFPFHEVTPLHSLQFVEMISPLVNNSYDCGNMTNNIIIAHNSVLVVLRYYQCHVRAR